MNDNPYSYQLAYLEIFDSTKDSLFLCDHPKVLLVDEILANSSKLITYTEMYIMLDLLSSNNNNDIIKHWCKDKVNKLKFSLNIFKQYKDTHPDTDNYLIKTYLTDVIELIENNKFKESLLDMINSSYAAELQFILPKDFLIPYLWVRTGYINYSKEKTYEPAYIPLLANCSNLSENKSYIYPLLNFRPSKLDVTKIPNVTNILLDESLPFICNYLKLFDLKSVNLIEILAQLSNYSIVEPLYYEANTNIIAFCSMFFNLQFLSQTSVDDDLTHQRYNLGYNNEYYNVYNLAIKDRSLKLNFLKFIQHLVEVNNIIVPNATLSYVLYSLGYTNDVVSPLLNKNPKVKAVEAFRSKPELSYFEKYFYIHSLEAQEDIQADSENDENTNDLDDDNIDSNLSDLPEDETTDDQLDTSADDTLDDSTDMSDDFSSNSTEVEKVEAGEVDDFSKIIEISKTESSEDYFYRQKITKQLVRLIKDPPRDLSKKYIEFLKILVTEWINLLSVNSIRLLVKNLKHIL